MKQLIVFVSLLATIVSCTRETVENGKVMLRFKNAGTVEFANVRNNTILYGALPAGTSSEYKEIPQPVYAPDCSFEVNGTPVRIVYGFCGTPGPSPWKPGNYTCSITRDLVAGNWFYNTQVTKD